MYLELLRRDYKVTVGRTGDKAIDFVCDKSGEKLYVQVAYLLASDETVQREFGAYNNIRDFLLAAITTRNMLSLWMSSTGTETGSSTATSAIFCWQRNGR